MILFISKRHEKDSIEKVQGWFKQFENHIGNSDFSKSETFQFSNRVSNQLQEPITRSLHLPFKHLESTLSDEKLFIEIVFAENLSRPNA